MGDQKHPHDKGKKTKKKSTSKKEKSELESLDPARVRHLSKQYEARIAALVNGGVAPPGGGVSDQDGGRRVAKQTTSGRNLRRGRASVLTRSESSQTALKQVSDCDSTSSSETEIESEDECWMCVQCQKVFSDDACEMMECERCSGHHCMGCLGMSSEVYGYMQKETPNTLWCCQECCEIIRASFQERTGRDNFNSISSSASQSIISRKMEFVELKLANMESLIESMYEYIACPPRGKSAEVDHSEGNRPESVARDQEAHGSNGGGEHDHLGNPTRSRNVWKKVAHQETSLRAVIREDNEEALKEAERAQRRRKNIVLHRVPESKSEEWGERKQHDCEVIKELMERLEIDANIADFYRLGRRYRNVEASAEPQLQDKRPLLVCLKSEEERGKILSSLGKLRNASENIKDIRVSPDMSMQERDVMRKLVLEAKNLTKQEDGDFRHIVRGKEILRVRDRRKRMPGKEEDQKAGEKGSNMVEQMGEEQANHTERQDMRDEAGKAKEGSGTK